MLIIRLAYFIEVLGFIKTTVIAIVKVVGEEVGIVEVTIREFAG